MAKRVVIENPIINSPFEEPAWHFRFGEDGITDEMAVVSEATSWGRRGRIEIGDSSNAKKAIRSPRKRRKQ